ncbi:MAG: hypothetical protein DHS20C01_29550 [marine bacterium B5-7]|nr:MAG: hypothetical protein DHS20C01_29550 [marine bacterium B5-7]
MKSYAFINILTTGQNTASHGFGYGNMVTRTLILLSDWHQRQIQRRDLSRLSEIQLNDLGIKLEDARIESQKPFWRR